MQEIFIDDFITNNHEANEVITDFSSNKIIIKDDTGQGATTAVLNIKNQNIIIISPLVGMIQGKENKRTNNKQDNQRFIYKDSTDKWDEIEKLIKKETQFILNTTPEQIIEIKKHKSELFQQIMEIPFFVDEFQIYCEAEYRESLSDFYNILFTEHKANSTLSTATPTINHLDIPTIFKESMQVYHIKNKNPRKKQIKICDVKGYLDFVKENCAKGVKVILHTNDINKIKKLLDPDLLPDYYVQYLVGEKLSRQASKQRPKTCREQKYIEKSLIDPEAAVIVLSTKYQIGFDIDFDCAVGIVCDQNSRVDNKTANEIIQCYGRCRRNVIEAKLFYSSKYDPQVNIEIESRKIEQINYSEHYLRDIQPGINKINKQLTYPKCNLVKSLEDSGFTIEEDNIVAEKIIHSTNLKENLKNLVEQDAAITQQQFKKVYSTIQGDNEKYKGSSKKNLLLWTAAYMIQTTKSLYLENMLNLKDLRYDRIVIHLKTFIDANELNNPDSMTNMDLITNYRVSNIQIRKAIDEGAICDEYNNLTHTVFSDFPIAKNIVNTLYVIYLVGRNEISKQDLKYIRAMEIATNLIKDSYIRGIEKYVCPNISKLIEKKDRDSLRSIEGKELWDLKIDDFFKNTNQNIKNALEKDGYTCEEIEFILRKTKKIKKDYLNRDHGILFKISINNFSLDHIKKKHEYYLLYMLSILIVNHAHGFTVTDKDSRQYTPITNINSCMRKYSPYRLLLADISSAVPSIIDSKFGTDIRDKVYSNIANHYEISRAEAKEMYNATLNNHRIAKSKAINILENAGYTNDIAEKIYYLSKSQNNEKGNFYRFMTEIEEQVVSKFCIHNEIDYDKRHRIHDAVLFYDVLESVIIDEFDEFRFTIETLIPPQE